MYLTFITERFSSDPSFIIQLSREDVPHDVKVWVAKELYKVTDWYYDYAEGPSYYNGKRSVELYKEAMKLMFPNDELRKEVNSIVDTKGMTYNVI